MRVWGKTQLPQSAAASVARRALEGVSRAGLVREAVMAVLESGQADRAGVWVESEQEASWAAHKRFSGLVAEPAVAASPSEWFTLSVEAPLPVEVMSGLQGVEQELLSGAGKPLIGALTEMRRALWIPVETRGRLRGVVFAGQRSKTAKLPWQAARSVAAELGLALELEDQRRRNDAHRASNDAVRSVLEALDSGKPGSEALQEIVTECTREGPGGGAALAVFAAIGRVVPLRHDGESAHRALDHDLEFLWRSGEHGWTGALAEEPLQSLWRSAIETHRVVGTELRQRLGQEEVGRIVVIPLQARGEVLGVFIGGIRERSSSLATLESMELRAALAADILLRERIEEAQRTRELRERALLAASRAAAVDMDEHGRMLKTGIIETQNSGKASFRSSTGSKEGKEFTELFAADCAAAVGNWLQESQTNKTSDIFGKATLRTGQHVRLRLLPTSEHGKRTVLLESLDSTGQNHEPSGLTELRNVIEWVDEGVVLFGANHEIRGINSRFAQIMGLAPEELERIQSFGDLLDVLSARLSNAGSLGQRWPGLGGVTEGAAREELRIERPIPRLVERVAHPILDETGALLGRVEIFRDLTIQRLFQSKLLQNGKLAELGQKLTAIAHELSNPLTSILGYAQRLLRRGEPRNDFREARQIFQEAERASAILRQLLLSVRESRPERRRVALNQLISRAADLNSHDPANDDVRFHLDLDPSLPLVKGDEGQLQQVLQNLIGNARQALASQGEGAEIRLTTRRIPDHRVLLEVADNGPGIPVSIQNRIFDPFFTTKPAGEGTGLGLSIVAGIVSEHGGQVRVKSSPGRGSVFSVELPATTALEIQQPKPGGSRDRSREGSLATAEPAAPGESGMAFSRWAGARVLVLEDEPTVARLIADVLEDEGLKVDTLLDSREALSLTARHDYAFVICDMKMPQLDGEEFYLTLLREGSPLCARFLFVTGDVLSARTRNFLERYELPYVAKPFRVEELTDKIRSVLERGKPFETGGDPVRKNAASK